MLIFKRLLYSTLQVRIILELRQTVQTTVTEINIFSLIPVRAAVQRLMENVGFCAEQ